MATEKKKPDTPKTEAKPMTDAEVMEKVRKGWATPEGFEFVAGDDLEDPEA